MKIEKEELNISDAKSVHDMLIEEISNDKDILVDMSDVKKIDMSIIQLFISAKSTVQKNSKKFELQNLSDEVSHILQRSFCDFLVKG